MSDGSRKGLRSGPDRVELDGIRVTRDKVGFLGSRCIFSERLRAESGNWVQNQSKAEEVSGAATAQRCPTKGEFRRFSLSLPAARPSGPALPLRPGIRYFPARANGAPVLDQGMRGRKVASLLRPELLKKHHSRRSGTSNRWILALLPIL